MLQIMKWEEQLQIIKFVIGQVDPKQFHLRLQSDAHGWQYG